MMPETLRPFCAHCLRSTLFAAALIEVFYNKNAALGSTESHAPERERIEPYFGRTVNDILKCMANPDFVELCINTRTCFLFAETFVNGTAVCRSHIEDEFERARRQSSVRTRGW